LSHEAASLRSLKKEHLYALVVDRKTSITVSNAAKNKTQMVRFLRNPKDDFASGVCADQECCEGHNGCEFAFQCTSCRGFARTLIANAAKATDYSTVVSAPMGIFAKADVQTYLGGDSDDAEVNLVALLRRWVEDGIQTAINEHWGANAAAKIRRY
jgi:hypothetical protein